MTDMDTDAKNLILVKSVEELFRALRLALPLVLPIPILMAWMLLGSVDHATLIGWLIAVLTSNLCRYAIARYHLSVPRSANQSRRNARALFGANTVDGLIWGSAAFLFFVPDSVSVQVLVYTLIVGLAAGSTMAMAYWPPALYAFALPAVGLAALRMGLEPEPANQALALLLCLFLAILFGTLHLAHRSARRSIELQFVNQALIVQLEQQKEAAEQASLAKSQFLAAASHDLRQPLHALELFAAVLTEKTRGTDNEPLLANVNRSLAALSGLFQSLLDVSRLDAGVIIPIVRDFDLGELFRTLIAENAPLAAAKGLEISGVANSIRTHSDPALVERVLRNLLSNAIRYTPSGSVRLEAVNHGEQITIAVTDTGPGIPVDQQQEVFEEFVQLHNPERDRERGLGLGLAIVRRLATLLDTRIALDSAPGAGSTFSFTLPAARHPESTAQDRRIQELSRTSAHQLTGRIILVIEDERAIRDAMRTLLDRWGCTILLAEDIPQALSAVDASPALPDLVIADYRLRARVTGAEAIQAVENHLGTRLPGVIITGDTAPERIREAHAAGHALLHKPVQAAKLRALLTHLTRSDVILSRTTEGENPA